MSDGDSYDLYEVIDRSLEQVWGVANELARIRPPSARYRVSIFGSARVKPDESLYKSVRALANKLSSSGCDIVTGGGPGLMQAANEGENLGDPTNKTRSIGIRVALPFEAGENPFVEAAYMHQTFFTRLHHFIRLSDAFVVVGGGVGTTLEMFMVWQLLQVKHIKGVPLILVGDMWGDLIEWARKHMIGGATPFAKEEDLDLPKCVSTTEEAYDLLRPFIEAERDITADL